MIWAVRLIVDLDRQFSYEQRQRLLENMLQVARGHRFEVSSLEKIKGRKTSKDDTEVEQRRAIKKR